MFLGIKQFAGTLGWLCLPDTLRSGGTFFRELAHELVSMFHEDTLKITAARGIRIPVMDSFLPNVVPPFMPKRSTTGEALPKARNYCARQERCQQEVRDKLYAWEVPAKEIEPIISQLIGEGFLNEARFAEHYAVSKSRQKGWGLRKIEAALKQKQVSEPCIRAALKAVDQEEQEGRLKMLVDKRWTKEKEPDPFVKRQKVMAYFLRRGFSSGEVAKAMSSL
ncbi:MAG: regulatory protein RecX [Flavobacteriales bacterium]|nr:regulatory protein RecX [Flavobacteriales bacterium]